MIHADHLQKRYPNFSMDISLSVPSGTVSALIGPNGSGKTTLFKLLLGLIHADGGSAAVLDDSIDHLGTAVKTKIGVVFNDSGFPGELKPSDLPAILKGFFPGFDRQLFESLVSRLQVNPNQTISSLSTGQSTRLKLAAALCHHPDLLILDEPTSGLDVIARDEILDLLREFMEDGSHSILISSHISSDLENFCDDVWFIENGRIELHDSVDDIASNYGLLRLPVSEASKVDPAAFGWRQDENGLAKIIVTDRQFYRDNYPDLPLEKCSLDDLLLVMTKGEKI